MRYTQRMNTDFKINAIEIHLAATQGFCAGVASAIEVVEKALEKYGRPLYVRHHIVHNTSVIKDFEGKGVLFIEDLHEVPSNKIVIFSAHGTAPEEYVKAKERGVKIIDATCPLVSKVHRRAVRFSEKGIQTILIGHRGHQELIGTSGYVNDELLFIVEDESDIDNLAVDASKPIGFLTQTTLSVRDAQGMIDKLKDKYPEIQGPPKSDICFATLNRQNAVIELSKECEVIIVCGSPHSSNSNRLRECAENEGVAAYIIDTAAEFKEEWITGKKKIGITSGASVPKKIVDTLVEKIRTYCSYVSIFQEESLEKDVIFPIPNI
jgi:4-hydroxy-3-methylbut-2-en-1-yl diphosphate reductase